MPVILSYIVTLSLSKGDNAVMDSTSSPTTSPTPAKPAAGKSATTEP